MSEEDAGEALRFGEEVSPAGTVHLASLRGRLTLTTVVLGSAVAMLTATVVNVALPTIGTDLEASSAGATWIINGYTLTLASFVLIGGTLGDRFGRVRVYRIGVAWFAVASVLCAVAWDVWSLVVFRMLQGVGGALLTPGSLAIIQATLRREDRGRGVGAWSGIGGVAGAVGPLLGGALVELSWRWVFLINLPVALAVLLLSRYVPESRDPDAMDQSIDLGGAFLTALVLGSISYALIEGPNGGLSLIEIGAGVVAVVGGIVLVRYERGRDHAMLPLDLFADRTFAVTNGLTFAVYGGMGLLFFLLTIQLQVTSGWSPLAAGAALLPVTLLLLFFSARVGELTTRIGARIPLTVGPLLIAFGMLLAVRVDADARFLTDVLPATVVYGFGLVLLVAPVTTTALGAVPDERAGAASGVNNAVARTGGLLTVAAVPGLVGITGDGLGDPEILSSGFEKAMVIGAAIVALAGVAAFLLLPRESTDPERCRQTQARLADRPCPVDGETAVVTDSASA